MKKHFTLEGPVARIRPANKEDVRFLFDLRKKANVNKTVHEADDFNMHEAWFERYLQKDDDYLFVVESRESGKACGSVALVDIDLTGKRAEFGRWLMLPGLRMGTEGFYLAFKLAFETLGLETVYLTVMARNSKVVGFYKAAGMSLDGSHRENVNGQDEEIFDFSIKKTCWPAMESFLEKRMREIFQNEPKAAF